MVDLREARRAAARIGLGLQYVLKEARVFDIWERLSPLWLSADEGIAQVVCKGGTALNKIYLGPRQRFSEDIDMDIVFEQQLGRREKIELVKRRVLPLLQPEYTVPRERVMRNVLRFTCQFTNEMGKADNVRAEFNLRAPLVGEVALREPRSEILGMNTVRVQTYSLATLVAQKIKAFYDRESGKDLYDIYYGLRANDDDVGVVKVLRDVVLAEGTDFGQFSEELPRQLMDAERIRRVHASANPYIPRSLRIDWMPAAKEIRERLLLAFDRTDG